MQVLTVVNESLLRQPHHHRYRYRHEEEAVERNLCATILTCPFRLSFLVEAGLLWLCYSMHNPSARCGLGSGGHSTMGGGSCRAVLVVGVCA